jgi:hypothetical protein
MIHRQVLNLETFDSVILDQALNLAIKTQSNLVPETYPKLDQVLYLEMPNST